METIYDLSFTDNRGNVVALDDFRGQPLLIVNTASKCGFAPQFDGLQELHEHYGQQGLVVLGFPCGQFANQEPGDDEEIDRVCRINHGVTFTLSTKVDVNGGDTEPVIAFVKERSKGLLGSAIKWNFTKFLVAGDGTTVHRYSPSTEPRDLVEAIERLLPGTAA
jgi:glutathione peroxidase